MYKDLASELKVLYGGAQISATAGGAGDNTAANGTSIDTQSLGANYHAIVFTTQATTTLAAGKSLVVAQKIQDSADNSTWADVVASTTVLSLTSAGGGTVTGGGKLGVPTANCRRYVRSVTTPDLDASGTDTATLHVTAIAAFPANP